MSYSTYVDTKGLDKADVIYALWKAATPIEGRNETCSREDCVAQLKVHTHFSTFRGRRLCVSMADKEYVKPMLYDQYNGKDAAEAAIKPLREALDE